jgi:hypothetical protein
MIFAAIISVASVISGLIVVSSLEIATIFTMVASIIAVVAIVATALVASFAILLVASLFALLSLVATILAVSSLVRLLGRVFLLFLARFFESLLRRDFLSFDRSAGVAGIALTKLKITALVLAVILVVPVHETGYKKSMGALSYLSFDPSFRFDYNQ